VINLVIFLLFGLLLCLVALRRPAVGVGLAAGADIMLMQGIPIGGSSMAPESFFFLYLATLPLLHWVIGKRNVGIGSDRFAPPVAFYLAFFAICVFSTLSRGTPESGVRILARLPLWGIFLMVPVWLLRTEAHIRTVGLTIVLFTLGLLAITLATGLPTAGINEGLLRSNYLNPLGHALGLGSILAYAATTKQHHKHLWGAASIALAAGAAMTHSRGAMAATTVGLLVCWYMISPGRAKRSVQLAGLAVLPLVLLALATGVVSRTWNGFATAEASSNLYRYQIMLLAMRLLVDNPLRGVGLGNLEHAGGSFTTDLRSLHIDIVASDNDYARIAAELGGLGIAVVTGWLFYVRKRIAAKRKDHRHPFASISPALVTGAGLGSYLVVLGLFESVIFSPTGWFNVGFCWACLRAKK
jgi:hypothetical protein